VLDSVKGAERIHIFVVLSDNNVYLLFMGTLVSKYRFAEYYNHEWQAFNGAMFKLPINYNIAVEAFEYGEQWCNENITTDKKI
jgi:hypothetical protein